MNIIVKAARAEREIVHVTPQSAGWRYVGFSAYRLRANEALDVSLPGREVCIVVLAGHADVSVAGRLWHAMRVHSTHAAGSAAGLGRRIRWQPEH